MSAPEHQNELLLDVIADAVAIRLATRVTSAEPEPWLTLEQAALYAQVSVKTLTGWIHDGWLASGGCGKTARVKRSDVDACMRRIAADDLERRREPVTLRTAQAVERLRKAG